jgi:hypothetical protein
MVVGRLAAHNSRKSSWVNYHPKMQSDWYFADPSMVEAFPRCGGGPWTLAAPRFDTHHRES